MEAGYLFHKILFGAHNCDSWRTETFKILPPILRIDEWGKRELPVFKNELEKGNLKIFGNFNEH